MASINDSMAYWSVVFTLETWQEAQLHGLKVMGFRDLRWSTVQRLQLGDTLICYLKGHQRFLGALRVIGAAYMADSPRIWASDPYPARIPVEPLVMLSPETAVLARDVLSKLEFAIAAGVGWGAYLQGGPRRMSDVDGETLVRELNRAGTHPRQVALDARVRDDRNKSSMTRQERQELRERISLQATLLEIGRRMRLTTWAPQGDHGFVHKSKSLGQLSLPYLPSKWTPELRRVAADVDVIWLQKDEIFACFGIEDLQSSGESLARLSELKRATAGPPPRLFIVARGPLSAPFRSRIAKAGCQVIASERIDNLSEATKVDGSIPDDLLTLLSSETA